MRNRPRRSRTTGKLIRACDGLTCVGCEGDDLVCIAPSSPFGEMTVTLPSLAIVVHSEFVIGPHATVRPGSSGSFDGSITLAAGPASMPAYYTPDPDGRGWTVAGSTYVLAGFSGTTEIAPDGIVCAKSGTILAVVVAYASCREGLRTAGAEVYTVTGCPMCSEPGDLASGTSSESTAYSEWTTSSYSPIFGTDANHGSVTITTSDASLPYRLTWPGDALTGPGASPSTAVVSWSTGTALETTVVSTCDDGGTNTGTNTGCTCTGCLCAIDFFVAIASSPGSDLSGCVVRRISTLYQRCDSVDDVAADAGWVKLTCYSGNNQIWRWNKKRCAADAIVVPSPPTGGVACAKCGTACTGCVRYDFTANNCPGIACVDCPVAVGFGEEADCPEGLVTPGSPYWTGWTDNGDGTSSGSLYVCVDDDTGEAPYTPTGPGCIP